MLDDTSVVVTDIRMPFMSMVVFMVKWSIAAIPAMIILMVIWALVAGVVYAMLDNLLGGIP